MVGRGTCDAFHVVMRLCGVVIPTRVTSSVRSVLCFESCELGIVERDGRVGTMESKRGFFDLLLMDSSSFGVGLREKSCIWLFLVADLQS